jgi:hypothetical protein
MHASAPTYIYMGIHTINTHRHRNTDTQKQTQTYLECRGIWNAVDVRGAVLTWWIAGESKRTQRGQECSFHLSRQQARKPGRQQQSLDMFPETFLAGPAMLCSTKLRHAKPCLDSSLGEAVAGMTGALISGSLKLGRRLCSNSTSPLRRRRSILSSSCFQGEKGDD